MWRRELPETAVTEERLLGGSAAAQWGVTTWTETVAWLARTQLAQRQAAPAHGARATSVGTRHELPGQAS